MARFTGQRLARLGGPVSLLDMSIARPMPKQTEPFYRSPEWVKLVATLIAERFGSRSRTRCEDPECRSPDRVGIRVFADHVKELKDGGAALDGTNILFRCGACHGRKTDRERAKRQAADHRPARG